MSHRKAEACRGRCWAIALLNDTPVGEVIFIIIFKSKYSFHCWYWALILQAMLKWIYFYAGEKKFFYIYIYYLVGLVLAAPNRTAKIITFLAQNYFSVMFSRDHKLFHNTGFCMFGATNTEIIYFTFKYNQIKRTDRKTQRRYYCMWLWVTDCCISNGVF